MNCQGKIAKEILIDFPSEKELLILGYTITNAEVLRRTRALWQREKLEIEKKICKSQITQEPIIGSDEVGGAVVLVDPNNLNHSPISSINVRAPMGLFYCQKRKILFTGSDRWIFGIAKGKILKVLNNQFFHCLHLLSGSQDGDLLVASTGIDAILKINIDAPEKLSTAWFATENGFNVSANGEVRDISRDFDHQHCAAYSTIEHTTHVNSVCEYKPGYVLATFFHQGVLALINFKSGQIDIVLDGLKNPHGIRKTLSGFLLSDTNGQRVIFFDNNLKQVKQIEGDYNWIQDAIELENGNIVIADADNGRVVVVESSGEFVDELVFGADEKRIGVLSTIKVGEAQNIFCA